MKKIIVALGMTLAVSTSFAFTGGEGTINKKAINAFRTEFVGATNATWTAGTDYYAVAFNMSGQELVAHYSTSGDLMYVTRNISSVNLPFSLQKELKKSYDNYWITELFELANHAGTSYYVTLETADAKVILKSTNGANWSVCQQIEKE